MCFIVFPDDYESVINEVLDFIVGQDRVCHNIGITDDDICENEYFFSNLELGGGEQPIDVDPEQAQVIIDDTDEPECGEVTNVYKTIKMCALQSMLYNSNFVPFWSLTE